MGNVFDIVLLLFCNAITSFCVSCRCLLLLFLCALLVEEDIIMLWMMQIGLHKLMLFAVVYCCWPGPVIGGAIDALRWVHDKKPGTIVFPGTTCTYRYATPVRGLEYRPSKSVRWGWHQRGRELMNDEVWRVTPTSFCTTNYNLHFVSLFSFHPLSQKVFGAIQERWVWSRNERIKEASFALRPPANCIGGWLQKYDEGGSTYRRITWCERSGVFISCSTGVDTATKCLRKKSRTEFNVPATAHKRGGENDAEDDDFGSSYVYVSL